MINREELEKKIQHVSKFCFNDPIGKGRIRNLMYEYECLRDRKNLEIAELKEFSLGQAKLISALATRIQVLEKQLEEK